ncbi:MAG TPA: PspC domain-containing protein [Flavobacteriales bacterium]|nr:PspC domain-containing protein [Flavobacteriales bacterium]HIN38857.1 PspC domain-containing protein [Flavobacteriales bacterium]
MKRTVTINLSGIIFHIDEDGHDKLSTYLAKIKSYFINSEGMDEIMADIESRIAEMFQEKISKNKEVITAEDVEQIIVVMGKPEDYIEGNGSSESTSDEDNSNSERNISYSGRRRVFRDPDNKVLGGVCGGISIFFNFDPIWLRLAFALSFFVFGTGFLLYLLLWIIIPEAKTTSEKLEMRGEKVNVSNIEKSIKEELENLKKKFNNFKDEASETTKTAASERAKSLVGKIIDFIINLLTFAVKTIAKFIGIIFISIGVMLIIILLSSLFGNSIILNITPAGITTIAGNEIINLFFSSPSQFTQGSIGIFLLLGIPIVALTYIGIKMLLGIRKKVPGLGLATLVLWITGAILVGYVIIQIADDFSKKEAITNTTNIPAPSGKTLYLEVIGNEYNPEDYNGIIEIGDWCCFYNDNKLVNFGQIKFDVVPSETDSFEITLIYSARGPSKKIANKRASMINYEFTQTDSLMQFNPYFSINNLDKWRNQKVRIQLKVPLNGKVRLHENMIRVIDDIDNVTGTYDRDMLGKTWTMLENGLTCVDCKEGEL